MFALAIDTALGMSRRMQMVSIENNHSVLRKSDLHAVGRLSQKPGVTATGDVQFVV